MTCPVCESKNTQLFVQRNDVPVHQNLLFESAQDARAIARGDLRMHVCEHCGFVFNAAFDASLLSYDGHYDNAQHFSRAFDAYLDERVRYLVEDKQVRNATIVEVGCGQGDFLRRLVAYGDAGNRGVGFDPTYAGAKSEDDALQFRRAYYDESCADVAADVVVCRHVIEHLSQPQPLLQSVRKALQHSPQAKVFFETPNVEWIVRNTVIWDFFYEHCSLFSPSSLAHLFARCGFVVDSVQSVFDGQYLWLEATVADEMNADTAQHTMVQMAQDYAGKEAAAQAQWLGELQRLRERGKVALWGAGAKGATCAHLVDPDASLIDCVVDVNPNKQGKYIAGSGHPIISPLDLTTRGVQHAVLMNPNYRAENEALLAREGIDVALVNGSEL